MSEEQWIAELEARAACYAEACARHARSQTFAQVRPESRSWHHLAAAHKQARDNAHAALVKAIHLAEDAGLGERARPILYEAQERAGCLELDMTRLVLDGFAGAS